MSLKETLEEIRAGFLKQAPPEAVEIMNRAVEDLAGSGIMDGVVGVGDKAPGFALPNPEGRTVALRDLLAQGPLVLSFYRGKW